MSQPFKDARIHNVSPVLEDGTVICHCGTLAACRTSQTAANPGRVFFTCLKQRDDPNHCKFWMWADHPAICNHPARQQLPPSSQDPSKSQSGSQPQPPQSSHSRESSTSPRKRPLSPSSLSTPARRSAPVAPLTPTRGESRNTHPLQTPSTPQGRATRLKDIRAALEQAKPAPQPASVPSPKPVSVALASVSAPRHDSEDEFEGMYDDIPAAERVAAGIQTDRTTPSSQSSQSHADYDHHDIDRSQDQDMADLPPAGNARALPSTPTRSRNPSPTKRARIDRTHYPSLNGFDDDDPFSGDQNRTSQLFTPPSTTRDLFPAAGPSNVHAALERLSSPTPLHRKDKGKGRLVENNDDRRVASTSMPGAYDQDQDDSGSVREVEADLLVGNVSAKVSATPSRSSSRAADASMAQTQWNPRTVRLFVEQMQDLPAYVEKLERKKLAAEKSCEAKMRRIDELVEFVEALQDKIQILEERNLELEDAIGALRDRR